MPAERTITEAGKKAMTPGDDVSSMHLPRSTNRTFETATLGTPSMQFVGRISSDRKAASADNGPST